MIINNFKFYPVNLIETPDKTFTIQTRNWESAISEANSLEEAQYLAKNLVLDVISSLFEDDTVIPEVAKPQKGDFVVELSL